MADQPGKDPEPQTTQEDHTTLQSLYNFSGIRSGRVFISVFDRNGWEHQVVVPIPNSYQNSNCIYSTPLGVDLQGAMKIALHQLGEHIHIERKSQLQDVFLQHRPKPEFETLLWANLPPEFWNEIVRDGDMLKLCVKPASERMKRGRTVKYVELLQRPTERLRIGRVITFPRPQSHAQAKLVARTLFYEDKQMSEMFLFLGQKPLGTETWVTVDSNITDANWMLAMEGNDEDTEIAVWGH